MKKISYKKTKKIISTVLLTSFFISFFQNVNVQALNANSTPTSTFTIEGLGNSKIFSQAVGLPNDKTAVLLRDSNYYSGKQYLRIFDKTGTKLTDVEVTSLMTTKYVGVEDYNIYGLDNGNVLIEYNRNSNPSVSVNDNAFFIVVDQNGNRVVNETQINTYSGSSLTRSFSITQLSNGNVAFAWQRGDNGSYATRVFTKTGSPVTNEIFVGAYNGSQTSIAASSEGTFMVGFSYNIYFNGNPTFYNDYKLYSNAGTLLNSGNIYTTTKNGPPTSVYVSQLSNGNYLYSYNDSTSSYYNPKGRLMNPLTGATISTTGSYASHYPGTFAVVKTSGESGFAVTSFDAAYLNAMNNSLDWTTPVNLNLNYYDNSGAAQFNKTIDSGYANFKDYDNDMESETWGSYLTSIGPSFYIASGYSKGLIEIKTDYSVDGSQYTITANLFDMTVAQNSSLSPNSANFDKNVSNQQDVAVDLTLNGNTLSTIVNGSYTLVQGSDYNLSETGITIKKEYLASLSTGNKTLTFNFSAGNSQNLVISVIDTTTYSVTFKDYDGTQLGTTQYLSSGSSATAPSTPTRAGYTFTGWDKTFNSITGNLIVTAQYSINTYSVTFKDYNNSIIGTPQAVNYAGTATAPSSPTRTGYTFTGWDKAFNNITGNLIVTAQYSINSYTVTFKDYDESTIGTPQTINYDGTATAPSSPTRTGYTFTGWNKTFNNITGDLIVTAQYSINSYTVTFKDYDESTIGTPQTINYGGGATAPSDPTRIGYTFTGWDKAFNNITGNLIVTAQYSINTYVVTFKDYDGTILKALQMVNYGGQAIAPPSPTRTGYTFTGWDETFDNVTDNLVVTAKYSINSYSVTFKDYDESTIGTPQTVNYGTGATAPSAPTRTGYSFSGWDLAFDNISGDLVITAKYTINSYSVTFKDYDESTIGTPQTVNYGASATAPSDPTRTGYTFTGWDKTFNEITGDLIVTAKYSINSYSVTFKDYDENTIGTPQTVTFGEGATAPSNPSRTGYTFTGWDKTFNEITDNLIVTAKYSINTYSVTFKDYDESTIGTPQTVNYGGGATAPSAPSRTGYTFTGWDKTFNEITDNLIVTAKYSINSYSVTFKDYDESTIGTPQTVTFGEGATAPSNPSRTGYTFTGWDKTFNEITDNLIVTAKYSINTYSVTFKDYDESTIGTPQTVNYGGGATAPSNPTRTGYTFTGWDKTFNEITGNLIVTAQYSIATYSVTFKDYDESIIGTPQTVTFGEGAIAPSNPTRTGYTFTGWDKTFNEITDNLIVTAKYSINTYVVTFKDYDGTILKALQIINYGGQAIAPINPARTGYTFTGWDKTFNEVTDNLVVTAKYSINTYSVTFKDYDGTTLGTPQTVAYGEGVTAPSAPTRTGYTFTGWDKALETVTGDLVVTAKYSINSYTVTFKDYDGSTIGTAQKVNYGGSATAPSAPSRTGYVFAGWDKAFTNITGNLDLTATYTSGNTYNLPASENTNTYTDTKASAGYLQSRDNTLTISSNVANLSIPSSAIDITGLSASDYIKITQKVVEKNTNVIELFNNVPSGVKMFGNPISLNIQLFDSNDTLIRDIHKFANNQKVKVTIKLTSDQIKGLDTSKLSMYYYDESNKKWLDVGGNFDANAMEYTFYTPHFTNFAIMEKLSATPITPATPTTPTPTNNTLPKTGSIIDSNLMYIAGILSIAFALVLLRKRRHN